MSAANHNRRSTDCGWITRWMAEHADVRNASDAVAFLGSAVCFLALCVMGLVMGGVL